MCIKKKRRKEEKKLFKKRACVYYAKGVTPGVKLIFPRFVLSDVNSCPTCAVSVEPMSCQCNCAELIAPEALAATVGGGGGGGGGAKVCFFGDTDRCWLVGGELFKSC